MRTPKEYTQNLKQKIITKQMLADCLYSVNKRQRTVETMSISIPNIEPITTVTQTIIVSRKRNTTARKIKCLHY